MRHFTLLLHRRLQGCVNLQAESFRFSRELSTSRLHDQFGDQVQVHSRYPYCECGASATVGHTVQSQTCWRLWPHPSAFWQHHDSVTSGVAEALDLPSCCLLRPFHGPRAVWLWREPRFDGGRPGASTQLHLGQRKCGRPWQADGGPVELSSRRWSLDGKAKTVEAVSLDGCRTHLLRRDAYISPCVLRLAACICGWLLRTARSGISSHFAPFPTARVKPHVVQSWSELSWLAAC